MSDRYLIDTDIKVLAIWQMDIKIGILPNIINKWKNTEIHPNLKKTRIKLVVYTPCTGYITPLVCYHQFAQITRFLFSPFNSLRPRQNGRRFADDLFKCIFLNENVRISIKISLKFVPKDPIDNISALVLIMAWHRPGDKLLSEPMLVRSLTHICVTRPQWVNTYAYCHSVNYLISKEYCYDHCKLLFTTAAVQCACLAQKWIVTGRRIYIAQSTVLASPKANPICHRKLH